MSDHSHSHSHDATAPKERHKLEGPTNHFLSYIVSILLTMIAFAVVMYGGLDHKFILYFLIVLALAQALFQLLYWMHMKERGHLYAAIAIAFGFIVALTAVAAGVFWLGW